MSDTKRDSSFISPESVTPYNSNLSKGEQIEEMFDHIAPAYDFMNSAMSLGQHKRWRRKAISLALKAMPHPQRVLDVATGTGDVAFALANAIPDAHITGADLSAGMLSIASKRLLSDSPDVKRRMEFVKADCLDLPFSSESFDLLTVAYGVRNFQNLRQGLTQMLRVLRPGGVACIIELARPASPIPLLGYKIYTSIIPLAGKLVAGDSDAYRYLPQSIALCPQRNDMTSLLLEVGFSSASWTQLTLGTICVYIAKK